MPHIRLIFIVCGWMCLVFKQSQYFSFSNFFLDLALGEPTPTLVPTYKDGWPNHLKVDEELKKIGIIG
jgi:hypothetical protein